MNRDLSARKVQYLLETIHYLVEKNCIDSAQDIIKKTEKALREVAEGEEKKELGLSLQREIIVSDVYYKNGGTSGDDIGKYSGKLTGKRNISLSSMPILCFPELKNVGRPWNWAANC